MYVILVWYNIRPEFTDLFVNRLVQHAQTCLREEKGCQRFDVCTDPKDRTNIFLYEVYRSEADFVSHGKTEHYKSYDNDVKGWVEKKHVHAFTTAHYT